MDVHLYDQQSDLTISKPLVKKLVKEFLKQEGVKCDEVSVHFVDTATISDLHDRFFNDPSTTDCISFPMDQDDNDDDGYRILGEVFVCPKTGIDYSAERNADPYKEVSLYIIHGLLHLVGYDDLGDAEPAMREAEEYHMKNLVEKNLLLKETTCPS